MSSAPLEVARNRLERPIAEISCEVDRLFDQILNVPSGGTGRLFHAMRYAAIGGGKRLRPLMATASGSLFEVPPGQSLRAGLAVECVHAHSLIHDDLPCMDDDDLRRGKPTVHIAFDEATAVLAGDALLALAFEILSNPKTHPDAERRCELAYELAQAAGAGGMAGGQMLDLLPQSSPSDLEAITRLQRLKTGALIGWAVESGAILAHAPAGARLSLRGYAQSVGLAFQIADDLLDIAGDEKVAGKKLRKDELQGKQTFVSLLGEQRARRQAAMLVDQAIEHLRDFGHRAELMIAIAQFAIHRDR